MTVESTVPVSPFRNLPGRRFKRISAVLASVVIGLAGCGGGSGGGAATGATGEASLAELDALSPADKAIVLAALDSGTFDPQIAAEKGWLFNLWQRLYLARTGSTGTGSTGTGSTGTGSTGTGSTGSGSTGSGSTGSGSTGSGSTGSGSTGSGSTGSGSTGSGSTGTPAQRTTQVQVSSASQLMSALAAANSRGGDTAILLADGVYQLSDTLYVNAPKITIASASGKRENVTIQGDAMSANAKIGNLIRVAGSDFELNGVTLQRSGWHLVQVVGNEDVDRPVIRNCVLRDSYEQMLKVTRDDAKPSVYSDNGVVENCVFEYTAGIGPQYYVGGIDAHGSRGWVVRGNTFRNIASPNTDVAEFAIHFWSNSSNNLVERNTIIDCDRGIGFGMQGRPNQGGVIRNNFIHHTDNGHPYADVGIALTESPGTSVHNNTVLLENGFGWSIEYRFASTTGVQIANNLANRPIISRDSGSGNVSNNVTNATRSTFRLQVAGDLHLAGAVSGIVDAGLAITGLVDDIDGQARPIGAGIDIGADER